MARIELNQIQIIGEPVNKELALIGCSFPHDMKIFSKE
jgi:hypothetical protein